VAEATRVAFGRALARLGEDPRIVVLDADLASSTNTRAFADRYPERFFQLGIAEGNMVGVAAGLALAGKIPVASSFACFLAGRFEQIRVSIAYNRANVKLVGTHAGVGIGEDGYSQMGLEDLALVRSLPGFVVVQPADAAGTEAAVEYLLRHEGPVYLRLTRQKVADVSPRATASSSVAASSCGRGGIWPSSPRAPSSATRSRPHASCRRRASRSPC
jgi:transketolase